jgi:hypothetical protein
MAETKGIWSTINEINFLRMMAIGDIQNLPPNHFAAKIKPIDKIQMYIDSFDLRDDWGAIDKNIMIESANFLHEKISSDEDITEDAVQIQRNAKDVLLTKKLRSALKRM